MNFNSLMGEKRLLPGAKKKTPLYFFIYLPFIYTVQGKKIKPFEYFFKSLSIGTSSANNQKKEFNIILFLLLFNHPIQRKNPNNIEYCQVKYRYV